jgi:hypothetical protein
MLGAHFESEIREQPDVWRAIARSDQAQTLAHAIRDRDVVLLGSGSSLYMAQLGALALRRRGIRAHALAATEAPLDNVAYRNATVIACSQSGRSADLLATLDVLQPKDLIALTNTADSELARRANLTIDLGAGPGINHVDPRPIGVSWWLSGTYDNYWTSITSSLASSYNVAPLPTPIVQRGNLIRSAFDPLFSGTLTADIYYNNYHFIPLIYYQGPSFSNIGVQTICTIGITSSASTCTNTFHGQVQAPQIGQSETRTQGYWIMNTSALVHLGPARDWTLGVQMTNLFSNTHDPTGECTASQLANTPQLGTGCGPFWPNSPTLVPATGGSYRTYQDYTQTTPQFELFLVKKIP